VPVTIKPAKEQREEIQNSLASILKDTPLDHSVWRIVQSFLNGQEDLQLWWAVFNDRIVGLIVINSTEIKALAVHPATRSRGIGRRMVALLKERFPALEIASQCRATPIFKVFQSRN
jgi:ribosomal protein S18 acetylase RimI-like enzyme